VHARPPAYVVARRLPDAPTGQVEETGMRVITSKRW